MRTITILGMTLLCLTWSLCASAQHLNTRVSLRFDDVTVEQALKEITAKYGIRFSYSNNVVPLKKKISVSVTDKSLRETLDKIFAGSGITYDEIGAQVILKKSAPVKEQSRRDKKEHHPAESTKAEKADSTGLIAEEVTASAGEPAPAASKDTAVFFTVPSYDTQVLQDTMDKQTLRRQYLTDKRKLRDQYYHKLDSLEGHGNGGNKEDLKEEFKDVMRRLRNEVHAIGDSLENIQFKGPDSLGLFKKKQSPDSSRHRHTPAQVTFLYPIGSNGTQSPEIVNNVSFNLLAGATGGTEGVELGGLLNVDKYHVKGTQIAGLGNVAGKDVTGGQFSGLFNINGAYTQGFQASGFMNVVADSAYALQGAGFMNLVGGSVQGGQFAGFTNIAQGRVYGMQGAGFMNVAGSDVYGGQASGFMNVSGGKLRGAQVAGFMNIAPDTTHGVQVAGFMNVGKVVTGSQIGFINFADTVTGAQIGFISFARRGYRRLELWGSESLYGNIAFKTGSHHFYNIFAAGIRPVNNVITWGYGYGIGSEIRLSQRLIMNTDLLAYNVHEDGFQWDELNLLNQFRCNIGWLLTDRTSIFAGPVFNVMVSNHYNSDTRSYGSDITPSYAFFDRTYDRTNVSMWIGVNAGIRF